MDTLTFIATLIGHIAWPVTVIVIFFILRRPLLTLFPLIQRLRFQGVELDFSRQVQALAVQALSAPGLTPESRGQLRSMRGIMDAEEAIRTRWIELAQFSPRAVVLEGLAAA